MAPVHAFPAEPNTAEEDWVQLVAHAPELALSNRPVVVVSPHPDDETMAVGGTIRRLRSREVDVEVVAVTDGEASHPRAEGLARRRREEQEAAMADLGVDAPLVRLGLPDTRVAEYIDDLVHELVERCHSSTVLIAPWERDGHADHDACGRAAADAAVITGSALWSYPVWAWQWATPDRFAGESLHKISLDAPARQSKEQAIGRYRSQTETTQGPPILGPPMLASFLRPWEVILRVR